MVAAALTLWALFAFWMTAPFVGIPPALVRTAAVLLGVELVALLTWSYGTVHCTGSDCAPLAQVAGIAARTDVPILAALFLAVTALRARA